MKLTTSSGARDLLRTFTDAATHVPRHRRTRLACYGLRGKVLMLIFLSFFIHVVDVLGPAEFLAPMLMLLTDKVSGRVCRQTVHESAATLSLPLAILQHYSPSLQVPVSICATSFDESLIPGLTDYDGDLL